MTHMTNVNPRLGLQNRIQKNFHGFIASKSSRSWYYSTFEFFVVTNCTKKTRMQSNKVDSNENLVNLVKRFK